MYHTIEVREDCSERVPYNIVNFPAYASQSTLSVYRDMRAASHWHDDLEFSVILSGHMTYAINGTVYTVNSGEGMFINARQLHSNYAVDGSDCAFICALVHPSLLCASQYVEETYISPLTMNQGFPSCILRPDSMWQAALMDAVRGIHAAFSGMEKGRELLVQSLAFQAVSLLCANMPAPDPLSARIDRRFVALRNMVGFVQQHYEERVSLTDIASAGNVSESSCCAIFRQQLHQTPIQYLTRYRVEKGMLLLEQPDLSVIDVALAVGFSSASYFTETFRKTLGLTPSDYRKRKLTEA